MIRYSLHCEACGGGFEGWFASSDAFDAQSERGLVSCALCGEGPVRRAIMAPAVQSSRGRRAQAAPEPEREHERERAAQGGANAPGPAASPPSASPPAMPGPPSPEAFKQLAARLRRRVAETHTYVGGDFAERATAMHEGREDHAPIYGETTTEQAEALEEAGVPCAPLPAPLVPPRPKSLN